MAARGHRVESVKCGDWLDLRWEERGSQGLCSGMASWVTQKIVLLISFFFSGCNNMYDDGLI